MIKTYLTFYLRFWLYSPVLWIISLGFLFLSGIFLNGFYFRLLSQQNDGQSISSQDGILYPYLSLVALLMFVFSPAFIFFQKNLSYGSDNNYLQLIPYNTTKLLCGQILSSLALVVAFLVTNLISLTLLSHELAVDTGIILSNYSGMLIITLTILSLSQFLMTWCTRFIHIFLAYFLILLIIGFSEYLASSPESLSGEIARWFAPLSNYRLFKNGIIPLSESLRFLALSALFIAFSILHMEYKEKFKRHNRALLTSCVSCLLILITMHGTYDIELKHTSSPYRHANIQLISALDEPLNVIAFTEDQDTKHELNLAFDYYKRRSSKLSLQFKHPGLSEQYRIKEDNKVSVMIQYEDRKQYLSYPFTPSLDERLHRSLEKLLQASQLITFVKTSSSRSPFGNKVRDIKTFASALEKQGFKLIELDLETVQSIPSNSDLLVFSSSDKTLPAASFQKIIEYIDNGGNFLWLREPNDEIEHHLLSTHFGLSQKPGTLVDPEGLKRGSPHPAIVLVDTYEQHPLTATLNTLSALPFVSGLEVIRENGWQVSTLLKSNASTWSDTSDGFSRSLQQASNPVEASAFNLILALERENHSQRAIVVGGGHFLSDAVIHNYGNLALGSSIVSWLAQRAPMLANISVNTVSLAPTKLSNFLLIYFYPWLLPLLVFVFGMHMIWKRYRHYGA